MNLRCKVCGEKAAGFHFGAFTCEGCKSFFGRCCNNTSIIGVCRNNKECVIDQKNRTSCKACRLQKCLLVGMSKSGSRYGRRSNWFKQYFQEKEQLNGKYGSGGGDNGGGDLKPILGAYWQSNGVGGGGGGGGQEEEDEDSDAKPTAYRLDLYATQPSLSSHLCLNYSPLGLNPLDMEAAKSFASLLRTSEFKSMRSYFRKVLHRNEFYEIPLDLSRKRTQDASETETQSSDEELEVDSESGRRPLPLDLSIK